MSAALGTARARIESLFPREAREGIIYFGWGLGHGAGPARYGWWVRWPSGRLDFLGERGVGAGVPK